MRAEFLRFQSCLFALLLIFARAASTQAQNEKESQALKEADAAFHAGVAARDAGKLDEAKADFAAVVRLAPKIPEGHAALGEVLIELGKPAEAAPEFEAALHLRPGDQGFEANLALADAAAGKAAKAVTEFAAALDLSKNPGGQLWTQPSIRRMRALLRRLANPRRPSSSFRRRLIWERRRRGCSMRWAPFTLNRATGTKPG